LLPFVVVGGSRPFILKLVTSTKPLILYLKRLRLNIGIWATRQVIVETHRIIIHTPLGGRHSVDRNSTTLLIRQ